MVDFNAEIIDKNFYCESRESYIKRQRRKIRENLRLLRNAMKRPLKRSDLFPPENYDEHYYDDMNNLD